MRRYLGAVLSLVVVLATGLAGAAERKDEMLVDIASVNPRIVVDLKYATTDNFIHRKVYEDNRCLLLKSMAWRLDEAQRLLEEDGLGIKIYDGFRPLAVQKIMWGILPDASFVGNPYGSGSLHNRGAAVDLTLVDDLGHELAMPTAFDTFSERAHRDSRLPTAQERANRMLLKSVMRKVGLVGIRTEWWHYQLPDGREYPIR